MIESVEASSINGASCGSEGPRQQRRAGGKGEAGPTSGSPPPASWQPSRPAPLDDPLPGTPAGGGVEIGPDAFNLEYY